MTKKEYPHWIGKEISQRFYFRYDRNDRVVYDEKRIRAEVEEKLQEKLGHGVFEKNARQRKTKRVFSLRSWLCGLWK
jgi:hypothetical protein